MLFRSIEAASCFNSLEMGTPAGRDHHLTAVQWHSLLYTACAFPEPLVHRLVRRHCQISSTSSQYFSFTQCYCCLDIICTSGFAFNFEGGQPVNHVVHMLNCIGRTTFGPLLTCLIKTRSPISHILIFFSHEFRLVISPFLVLGIFKASKTIGYVHQEQMEQQC